MTRSWCWPAAVLANAGVEFTCAARLSGFWQGFALVLGGMGVGAAAIMIAVNQADRRRS